MKSKKALAFFLSGTAIILLTAAGLVRLARNHPLAFSLLGALLLSAGALALLLRRLPLLLFPRRTAERQLSALLEKSSPATLLYCDSPEEDAVPLLAVPVHAERWKGLQTLLLTPPAVHPDLSALLALPPGTELTAVFPVSPAEGLHLTGTAAPLSGGGQRSLLLTVQSIRLPGCRHDIPFSPAEAGKSHN